MYSDLSSCEFKLASASFMSVKHKSNCSIVSGGFDEEDSSCLEWRRLYLSLVASMMDEYGTAETLITMSINPHAR